MWEYQLQDHIHHIFSFYITAEHLANCASAFKTIVFFSLSFPRRFHYIIESRRAESFCAINTEEYVGLIFDIYIEMKRNQWQPGVVRMHSMNTKIGGRNVKYSAWFAVNTLAQCFDTAWPFS